MKRYSVILILLLLFLSMGAGAAQAQSLVGSSQECGTYIWAADLIKGRTDGMVVHAHHAVGCWTYDFTNLIGADAGRIATNEKSERAWQTRMCIEDGQQQVVGHFRYYRGIEINPDDVKVTCTPYSGPD